MIVIGLLSQDQKLTSVLSSALGTEFEVVIASCGSQALELVACGGCDVVIIDLSSSCEPMDLQSTLCAEISGHGVPVVVMAEDEHRREALDLVERGAHSYARKPPAVRELKTLLRKAHDGKLLKVKLETAQRQLQNTTGLDKLIGSSAQMQVVYDLIRRVAPLTASVLVTGESGTGKELVARAIHNLGSRAQKPFVALACGAIPDTLIEAELFGHEKGAFTGSVAARQGYLEQARDGTLFLDEIGELSLHTQVKLLRVLQQREFTRLGSSFAIPLRARIVFATHRDLNQMVAEGKFRQDLFYRIDVMNIQVPALRHHAEDISLMAKHFLHMYSQLYGDPALAIEPDALALLQHYDWPGNVRELENVIQRAIIMAQDGSIGASSLPERIRGQKLPDFDCDLPAGSFERLLRDYKVKLANEAIQLCQGNKTMAAQSLSISRAYLHRLIRPTGPGESNAA
jgi:DNA-binding NtrC family response regulator